jgi:FAD/FMN-containing dehydrogenase
MFARGQQRLPASESSNACENWSGSLRFSPQRIETPQTESALAELVREAAKSGMSIRPVGSGHSSTPIFATEGILVSLGHFQGLKRYDLAGKIAVLAAGTEVGQVGKLLHSVGLALPTYGDVATQTIAGVISTGTHGSGRDLWNLSMTCIGGRAVTAAGEIFEFTFEENPDFVRGFRVSLGTLGILTEVTLRLMPDVALRRQEWCTDHDRSIGRIDELSRDNHSFDFYWYPRSDEVKLRCINLPERAPDYSDFAKLVEDRTGPSFEVVPKHSGLPDRFDEMEYSIPAAHGLACFEELRGRIKGKWRRIVGWRLLYRFIKADDSWLSEAYGRETVSISLHQNSSLHWREFFRDLEPIFWAHEGRTHWAKKHTLKATELRDLYPMWQPAMELRRQMDPNGTLLTPYLRELLDV